MAALWLPVVLGHLSLAHGLAYRVEEIAHTQRDYAVLVYRPPEGAGRALLGWSQVYGIISGLHREGYEVVVLCNGTLALVRKEDPLILGGVAVFNGHFANREIKLMLGSVGLETYQVYWRLVDPESPGEPLPPCAEPTVFARIPVVFKDRLAGAGDVEQAKARVAGLLGGSGLAFRLTSVVEVARGGVEEAIADYEASLRLLAAYTAAASAAAPALAYMLYSRSPRRWPAAPHRGALARAGLAAAALAAAYLALLKPVAGPAYHLVSRDALPLLATLTASTAALLYAYARAARATAE